MIYHVYRIESPEVIAVAHELPEGSRLVEWKPSLFHALPAQAPYERAGLLKNWVFHIPWMLFNRKRIHSVYSLVSGAEVLCQCMVTPASFRFGFMGPKDLQFGLVFTPSAHRKKHLASAMVRAIMQARGWGRTYWWLAAVNNPPSQAFAARFGFTRVGLAKPTSGGLGLSRYVLSPEGQG